MSYKIIKVTASAKVKDRYYLDFEDGETLTVGLNQIADFGLCSGRTLTENEYCSITEAVTLSKAKAKALRALGSRPYSRAEMAAKLKRAGTAETVADTTAEWLETTGIINDTDYAEQIVRHYASKGYGAGKIRDELRKRGIARDEWDDALEQMPETEDIIYQQLLNRLHGSADKKERDKAIAAMMRRGFSWEEIKRALNRMETDLWEEKSE